MDEFSRLLEPVRCNARGRQTGLPCQRWSVPGYWRCILHGGNTVKAREESRRRMLRYEMFSSDPSVVKQIRIRKWRESYRRWEMRRAKKKGPAAVRQLLAEWEFEKTEKRQIAEDNRRARQEKIDRYKREQAQRQSPPPSTPYYDQPQTGGHFQTGFDWSNL